MARSKTHQSAFQKWLNYMKSHYEGFDNLSRNGKQLFATYGGQSIVPPRMPQVEGPSPGADLTAVQLVNQFGQNTGIGVGGTMSIITQSTSSTLFGQCSFLLSDLPQVAQFANMFDQYRFEAVHFRVRARSTSGATQNLSSATSAVPYLLWVIDRDDATAPTSIAQLQQYDNVHEIEGFDSIDIFLEPSLTRAVYASGVFSGYEVVPCKEAWLDLSNTAIPHYGVKFMVSGLDALTTSSWIFEVCAWYKCSFKNVR
jgi:hypothetical protein